MLAPCPILRFVGSKTDRSFDDKKSEDDSFYDENEKKDAHVWRF
jgi:hypothetical protein